MTGAIAALGALVALVVASVAGLATLTHAGAALEPSPASAQARAEIPADLVPVYQGAALACAGLPWQVLAAIGFVESGHAGGRADPATGAVAPPIVGPPLDGRPGFAAIADPASSDGWAHAAGPMQFLPATWARWATLAPGRPPGAVPDPHNAWDAIYAAGRKLCGGRGEMGELRAAILAYNRSEAYYAAVWERALAYGMAPTGSADAGTPTGPLVAPAPGQTWRADRAVVVGAALGQLGVPYVWGGTTPGVALDCSGLVVVAYAAAGVRLPRTTASQVNLGVPVPVDAELAPGDLVFFRGGRPTHDLGHVGLYVGDGLMVIAPRSGEVVSLRPLPRRHLQLVRRLLVPGG